MRSIKIKNIFNFLGLKKNLSIILVSAILLELGEKIGERFLPIYMMALGGGAIAIGFLNAMDNLLGALYSLPGGYLSDKFGYKKSLTFFNIIAMLGYLIVIIFPYWQAILIGAALFISWSSISLPAIMSAITKNLPKTKQVMGVTMHSLVRRIPMALGPVIGGICIAAFGEKNGIRFAFIISFFFAFISIFIQHYLIDEAVVKTANNLIINPFKIFINMKPNLKNLLVSDILIRFCEQIPYAFIVVWCIKNIGISAVQFGLLTTIEMITAILVYIPVAYFSGKAKSKKIFITITFVFFALFPISIMYSSSMLVLIFVFILRGLKEFGEPNRKALILDLADNESKATMYGAYYLIRDSIVSISAFAGGILWMISPQLNFITASMFGLIGVIYFVRYCKE